MKIAMVGAGYVGLVSGVCFSDFGHTVVCVEKDAGKLAKLHDGQVPIYEPGLDLLMEKNMADGRLSFTGDLREALVDADACFIAVGTPTRRGDGHADLSYVLESAREIAEAMPEDLVVVIKSTVPVGTNRKVDATIRQHRPGVRFHMASNPEFLREGVAIADFTHPDRVVVGLESEHANTVLNAIYRPITSRQTPLLVSDPETAELIKYAANSFLAMKITFINEVANLCERVGGDVQAVAHGIGLDSRIGERFLNAGPGYGGSCFPKDTKAFAQTGQDVGARQSLVEATIRSNDQRKSDMADKIVQACHGSVLGKKIAVMGVTFKPETDDMRDAPSLTIIPALQAAGAEVVACDPQAGQEARDLLAGVGWCEGPYEAAKGCDAVVILTEWNQFRGLNLGELTSGMRGTTFIDLRNLYEADEMRAAGLDYWPVGKRPTTA